MSFGATITNTQNQIVIDHDFKNYAVVSSGTGQNIVVDEITTTNEDLVLARPITLPGAIYRNYSSTNNLLVLSCSSGVMEWVVARPNPAVTGTHGIRVFGPDGQVAFDSNRRVVCPRAVISPGSDGVDVPGPGAPPPGKNRYLATGGLVFTREYSFGGSFGSALRQDSRALVFNADGSYRSATVNVIKPGFSTIFFNWSFFTPRRFLVCDV